MHDLEARKDMYSPDHWLQQYPTRHTTPLPDRAQAAGPVDPQPEYTIARGRLPDDACSTLHKQQASFPGEMP